MDKDKDYIAKEISKFNNVLQNLFGVYSAKYGSITIYGIMRNLGAFSSFSQDKSKTIRLYHTLKNENIKRARSNTPNNELRKDTFNPTFWHI